nr:hypothetical protein [Gemmobacter aquarius]
MRSITVTPWPARAASSATNPPIGPAPATTKGTPAGNPIRRSACSATAKGSAIARCRSGTPAIARKTFLAGKVTASAKPPSITSPTNPSRAHTCPRPSRQAAQTPQVTRLSTTTRSPNATWSTPAPSAVTTPVNSCPATTGDRLIHAPVRKLCKSDPQIPAAVTASVTSPADGGAGAAISSTRKSPLAYSRTARIAQPFR